MRRSTRSWRRSPKLSGHFPLPRRMDGPRTRSVTSPYFDGTALLALIDPDEFSSSVEALLSGMSSNDGDPTLADARAQQPGELLAAWRAGRTALLDELAVVDPKLRVPWYGPPMSAMSFATARLMETWAHGQDVVDAVGAVRPATDRLRHVAHIGVRARPFSYATNAREVPSGEVRVELVAPSGAIVGVERIVDRCRSWRRARLLLGRDPTKASRRHRSRRRGTACLRLDGDRAGVCRSAGRRPAAGTVHSRSMSVNDSA